MRICNEKYICPLAIAVIILSLFVSTQAQTKKSSHRGWDWKKHKVETIHYAMKYLVSNIEPNLPDRSLQRRKQLLHLGGGVVVAGSASRLDSGGQDFARGIGFAALGQDLTAAKECRDVVREAVIHVGQSLQSGRTVLLGRFERQGVVQEQVIRLGGEHFFQLDSSGHDVTFEK